MEDLAVTRAADLSFWRGRRVLLTGHTGFKGAWLTVWLHRLGASVTGISLPPLTVPNLFEAADLSRICDSHFCDVRDGGALTALVHAARPEIVLHLAAQPLVRVSYQAPLATIETNVMGTAHVLDALRGLDCVRVAVMVTTDKVYRDSAKGRPSSEEDPLGGRDPYSASKAACEIVIASYRDCFLVDQGTAVASARAGNVIGGGDGSDGRLIPDAIRAWQAGKTLEVRRPRAVRPWQHVLEPLAAYLTLARRLWQEAPLMGAYNFGPANANAVTVREVVEMARRAYGGGAVNYSEVEEGPHESAWLSLENRKAREMLGIVPGLSLAQSIERTVAWYRAHRDGADAFGLCGADIMAYEALA